MSKVKKLLFATNSEFGQASVHISVIRELLSREEPIEIHLLSFPSLQARILDLESSTSRHQFRFHPLTSALSFVDKHEEEGTSMTSFIRHRATFRGAMESYSIAAKTCIPWTGEEYVKLYEECFKIIKDLQPDLVVCDIIFFPSFDACQGLLNQKYIILAPTPFRGDQSLMRTFSYPALSSGYSYPVPLLLKPLNFILTLFMIGCTGFGEVYDVVKKARKAQGIQHPFPSLIIPRKVLTINASAEACDLPFTPNPELSLPVGPMVQPIQDLQEVDPELYQFLSKKPTILLALGSHVHTTEKMSLELSLGFKKVLEKRKDVQVLWKVRKPKSSKEKPDFDPMDSIQKILGDELNEGRIRIVEWLNVDPISILSTEFISCFINHGGANSFLESVYAGVPQVVLSCWFDTMETGAKVEYLKIGTYGNRKSAPDAESKEFSQSLLKVIGDGSPEGMKVAETIKTKAMEVGERSRAAGGAQRAGDKILELAG